MVAELNDTMVLLPIQHQSLVKSMVTETIGQIRAITHAESLKHLLIIINRNVLANES